MHRFTELLKSSLEFSDRDKEVIKIAETPFLSSFSLPVKFFVNGAKKVFLFLEIAKMRENSKRRNRIPCVVPAIFLH